MLKNAAFFLITLCLCGTAQATLILSTTSTATLGSTTFRSDVVVSYENGILSPLFSGNSVFDNRENIDAFSWLDDTRFVFSTSTDGAIGGFTFNDGDLIQWDTAHNTASLFLSESMFSDNEDIAAKSLFRRPAALRGRHDL